MNVRVNSITGVPCWFTPVVFTRTMPTFGRDFDWLKDFTSAQNYLPGNVINPQPSIGAFAH